MKKRTASIQFSILRLTMRQGCQIDKKL